MKTKIFIKNNSIALKTLTKEEIKNYFHWFNDQELIINMNKGHLPNNINKQKKIYSKMQLSDSDIQLGIYKNNSSKILGLISLNNIDFIHRSASISILLGEISNSNKGIGSMSIKLLSEHAFNKLNLRKLKAGMWKSNIASRYAFEKNGFKKEAVLKKEYEFNGKFIDSLILSKFKN